MRCQFCEREAYYEIRHGNPKKQGAVIGTGVMVCKSHASLGRGTVAAKRGGRPGVNSFAQRIIVVKKSKSA